MSRYKSYLPTLLTLLSILTGGLLTGCSDDFNWRGENVAEDEYLIAFSTSSPIVESITKTRATDQERNKVKEVALVMFNGDMNVGEPQYFTLSSTPAITPEGDGIGGSIKVKKSSVREGDGGDWYLIANANSLVKQFMDNHAGDTFDTQTFLDGISASKNQLVDGGDEPFIMAASKAAINIREAQTTAPVFNFDRLFTRISVLNYTTEGKFLMTGTILDKYAATGTASLSGANALTANDLRAASESWQRTPATQTTDGITHTKAGANGDQLTMASFPYSVPTDAEGNVSTDASKIMYLVIEGYFDQATQEDIDNGILHKFDSGRPCYYAVALPNLEANHLYRVIIEKVPGEGHATAEEAIANPGGLSIDFIDTTDRIRDIISDGKNVLAVCDTVRIEAVPETGNIITRNLPIKARHEGKSNPTVTLTRVSGGEGWLTLPSQAAYTFETITNEEETSNGLFTSSISIEAKASINEGSEREAVYKVKLEGTELERNVVFLQEANTNVKYSKAMDIKLTIKRGSTNELAQIDYLRFINPDITTATSGTEALGVKPYQNGGRIRNLGLHAPMPNGGNVTYTYTITLLDGATIEENGVTGTKSGNTYTYTFTDGTDYGYRVTPDAITIKQGTTTYTLDVYHTGFFYHHTRDGFINWHYYEVFTQNSNLHWLDRNLEATSAGMGVRTNKTTTLTSESWPIVGTEAMGQLYLKSEADAQMIPGWNLPTYAQMRSLTVLAGFTTQRLSTVPAQTPYYAPSYLFAGTEGTKNISVHSYFPQNMLQEVSGSTRSYAGDKSSGYYMTRTSADAIGWYQCMQFTGMNVTSLNRNVGTAFAMSVRPCTGTYNPEVEDEKYTVSVKGYTHVFLYYLNTDGSKTYLTSWPGEQVAVYGDTERYHPFEITPTMAYNKERLYVIFNEVQNGVVRNSNVDASKVNSRTGIKFINGGLYDKDATTTATGAKEGNWTTPPERPYLVVRALTSEIGTRNHCYVWTGDGDNLYFGVYGSSAASAGTKDGYRYWKAAVSGTIATPTGVIFKDNNTNNDGKLEITDASKIIKETDPDLLAEYGATVLITVTTDGQSSSNYTYNLHGQFTSSDWTDINLVKNATTGLFEAKSVNVTYNGGCEFGIKRSDNAWVWLKSGESLTTNGTAMDCAVQSGNNGANWRELGSGTYDFVFDETAMTLKITSAGGGGGGGDDNKKYLVIRVPNGEVSQNYIHVWGAKDYTTYSSAPSCESTTLNGYKYWKIEVSEAVTSLNGIIFKNAASGNDGKDQYDDSKYWHRVTDATVLAQYGATSMFTFDLYCYEFHGECFGNGSWETKTADCDGNVWTLSNIGIVSGDFGIRKKRHSDGGQDKWVRPKNSSDIEVSTNKDIECAYEGEGSADKNFHITGNSTRTFKFDPVAMTLRVTQ